LHKTYFPKNMVMAFSRYLGPEAHKKDRNTMMQFYHIASFSNRAPPGPPDPAEGWKRMQIGFDLQQHRYCKNFGGQDRVRAGRCAGSESSVRLKGLRGCWTRNARHNYSRGRGVFSAHCRKRLDFPAFGSGGDRGRRRWNAEGAGMPPLLNA